MCQDGVRPLTFENMLTDPMVRMMMDADRVTLEELVAVMAVARESVAARERLALSRAAAAAPYATSGRA